MDSPSVQTEEIKTKHKNSQKCFHRILSSDLQTYSPEITGHQRRSYLSKSACGVVPGSSRSRVVLRCLRLGFPHSSNRLIGEVDCSSAASVFFNKRGSPRTLDASGFLHRFFDVQRISKFQFAQHNLANILRIIQLTAP